MDLLGTGVDVPDGWDIVSSDEGLVRARRTSGDGSVDLACHAIMPGIILMDISLACSELPVDNPYASPPLTINWCSAGRCEVDLGSDGSVVVDRQTLCLSSSVADTFLYPTGSYLGFEYLIDPCQITDAGWETLGMVGVSRMVMEQCIFPGNHTLTLRAEGGLAHAVSCVEEELRRDPPRQGILAAYTLILLACLADLDLGSARPAGTYLRRSQRDMANAVYRQIMSELSPSANLSPLARRLGTSEASLRSFFKKVYGESPAAFARRRCLDEAKELLSSGDAPVGEVAITCGYSNQSKFAAAFRRAYGMSPVDFRHLSRMRAGEEGESQP